MFEKNDKNSQKEVDEIVERFNLQELSASEKETIISMARDRTLVSLSSAGISQGAFEKTSVYQNWMILSQLSRLNVNIEKLLNK